MTLSKDSWDVPWGIPEDLVLSRLLTALILPFKLYGLSLTNQTNPTIKRVEVPLWSNWRALHSMPIQSQLAGKLGVHDDG